MHQNLRAGVETRPYGWIDNPQFCSIFIFAWLGKGKTVPPDRLFRSVQIRNLLHGFICHGDGDRTAATAVFNHDHNRKG